MDNLRKEYQIQVQEKLKKELFDSLGNQNKTPKREGADKTEEDKK